MDNNTYKFLIVDDSADFQALLTAFIRSEYPDANVVALDGIYSDDEIKALIPEKFDAVFLDYQMDGRDGLRLLRDMRQLDLRVPTILLTAYGDEKLAVRAMREGAYDYLPKGTLTKESFLSALDEVIDLTIEKTGVTAPAVRQVKFGHNIVVRGYRPVEMLGKGGNASAFLAENEDTGERVVLKIMSLDNVDETDVMRFMQEYEIMSDASHDHIGQIFSQGFDDNVMFMIMEYLPGGSLKQKLPRVKERDDAYLLNIIKQIAEALGETHRVGIIHRDVKPANIMFRDENTAVLIDYGAAKGLSDTSELTQQGQAVGTPYYMSPEQVSGDTAMPQSDIYGLGIILYEIMTGVKPYASKNLSNVLYSHLKADIPALPADRAQYQPLVEKMMAKKPEDRFDSTAELIDVIDSYLLECQAV